MKMAEKHRSLLKVTLKPILNIGNIFGKSKESVTKRKQYILPSDTPSGIDEKDLFERENIAFQIFNAITTTKGQMNFMISGSWGMGKTSVLNEINKKLKDTKVTTIWFSPWKYSSDNEGSNSISRAFLVKLSQELGRPQEVKNLYINRKIETHRNVVSQFLIWISLIALSITFLLLIALIVQVLITTISSSSVVINVIPDVYKKIWEFIAKQYNESKDKLGGIFWIIGLLSLPALGDFFVGKTRKTGEVSKDTSPELLEETFQNLLNKSLRIKPLQNLISLWESTVVDTFLSPLGIPLTEHVVYRFLLSKLKLKKLVVFVDDLDRCDGVEIKNFLSGIKTFLSDSRVCFVIAADLDTVVRQVEGKDFKGSYRDYLRKIVQIDWNVPSLRKKQIKHLLMNLTNKAGIEKNLYSISQLTNLSVGFPNPRKIKYFVRRLLFILNTYNGENNKPLSREDIAFLYKLIILSDLGDKDGWFDYLAKNPEVYRQIENKTKNSIEPTSGSSITLNDKEIFLIREHPLSIEQALTLKLAKVFSMVWVTEGKGIVSEDFLEMASNEKVKKALDFLKMVIYDYEILLKLLITDIEQDLGKLATYIAPPNPIDTLPEGLEATVNRLNTVFNIFNQYYGKSPYQEVNTKLVSQLFISLNQIEFTKFIPYFWNFSGGIIKEPLINTVRQYGGDALVWLDSFIDDPLFNTYSSLNEILSVLDKNGTSYKELSAHLSDKFASFLTSNFDEVMVKLNQKIDLIPQISLVAKFKEYPVGEVNRNKLFTFIKDKYGFDNNDVLSDLLQKQDYGNVVGVLVEYLKNQQLIDMVREHLLEVNFEELKVLDFIKAIWKLDTLRSFSLIDKTFLTSIQPKIGNLSDATIKNGYLEVCTTIKTTGLKKSESVILCDFYNSLVGYTNAIRTELLKLGGKVWFTKRINKLCGNTKFKSLQKNGRSQDTR